MSHRTSPESPHKACLFWLIATVAVATAALALTLTGHGDHPASWPLRIAAAIFAVGWMIRLAEARLSNGVDKALRSAWWMGYATCLEDQSGEESKVVPLHPRPSDKISDTKRRMNGTEHS